MEFLEVLFPISGVKTNILVPPLVAMAISFFTSMGGVSGAFLILPFQMSVMGYTTPSVSGTNFVYNIVGIPSGVYGYIKEGRMNWPLSWAIIVGTMPGLIAGYYIRVLYLPDPKNFKVFVGLVLLYIATKMLYDAFKAKPAQGKKTATGPMTMRIISKSFRRVDYEFMGETYGFNVSSIMLLSLFVGVIGGVYGIGGGAIIAPFCVAVLHLPVYTVAGAALLGTLVTSVAGVFFYSVMPSSVNTLPDWPLGILFGIGGFAGMYLGSRVQRHVPQKAIKIMLGSMIMFLSLKYILRF